MYRLAPIRRTAALLGFLLWLSLPVLSDASPRPERGFVRLLVEAVRALFEPIGHEIDPNGTPNPSGSTPPAGTNLGHEIDPNGTPNPSGSTPPAGTNLGHEIDPNG